MAQFTQETRSTTQEITYCILGTDVRFGAWLGGTFTRTSQQTKGYIDKYALAATLLQGLHVGSDVSFGAVRSREFAAAIRITFLSNNT